MLGLELAPQAFCPDPNPCLVATTENGTVIQIDLNAPDLDDVIRSEPGARFSDLVFASDGTFYVVDCDDSDPPIGSRILEFGPAGNFVDDLTVDGRLDGIEIDEGGDRLLVVAGQTPGPDQVLEITLPLSPSSDVTALADIDVDDAFFPTGIIYDRLGDVAVRKGNNFTALQAESVGP
jgi:DNA-binding beta-propeller fold protein YncE